MGQKLTWWGSNSYLRNAIRMWCGVCEQGYGKKGRKTKRKIERNGKSLQVHEATREHRLEERG